MNLVFSVWSRLFKELEVSYRFMSCNFILLSCGNILVYQKDWYEK